MIRFWAAAAIVVCLLPCFPLPARSQPSRTAPSESRCFPWQELKGGFCVPKPATAAAPSAPMVSNPCDEGRQRNLTLRCRCPPGTRHDQVSGQCVANATVAPQPIVAPRPIVTPKPIVMAKPNEATICDGGTLSGGACACPAGFHLMPTGHAAGGGRCVKLHAENCLGGELTVSGTCLCTAQVVMSGKTYGLEDVGGKCLPKRCPMHTVLKGDLCIAASSAVSAPEPETAKPAPPRQAARKGKYPRRCGRGMVHTHSGCVAARRHHRRQTYDIPDELRRYYRDYGLHGFSSDGPAN